ncbi:glycosyltransferase [Actinobacillus equuli subsp. equuli]|uniref:glycosyltransferase family 2 protein n=1 Tax=Actinobacillus equuli TaxID=718 RepID=UPI002441F7AC|nr:glycosyltransferase [Actinobacillus equuli]WGE54968.1 glycosyltransferase [Actinobacillus equuli subsp. equuli]
MINKISIIVPVYNAERFLSRCVSSILGQTYKNIEVILVDDGSKDSSLELCHYFSSQDNRVKVFHQDNAGAGAARNLGIAQATGDYIGFVDADDWIDSEMYQYLYNLMTQYDADMTICEHIRCEDENEAKEILIKIGRNKVEIAEYDRDSYVKKYMKIGSQTIEYYPCNKLYKRSLLVNEQYPIDCTTEDVVGTYKAVLKAKKIIYSSKVGYLYFYNQASVSSSFLPEKGIDMLPAWDEVVALSEPFPQYLEWAKINRARIDFNFLFQISTSKNYPEILVKNKTLINELISKLKLNKDILLNADISFSRKVLIYLFCLDYKVFSKMINLIYKK